MLIWAWIFAIPFVAAVVDLAATSRRSHASNGHTTARTRTLVPRTNG